MADLYQHLGRVFILREIFLPKLPKYRICQTIAQSTRTNELAFKKNPRKILKKISAYAILKKPQKLGPIWNTTKSRHIIRQNKALDIYSLTNVVFRSFKVTQGQKLPIKGHKGHISIFIKSSQVVHEKGALEMSLLMTLVSRSIKVTQAQNLPIRVCKSLFSIIESRVEHSKFSPLG